MVQRRGARHGLSAVALGATAGVACVVLLAGPASAQVVRGAVTERTSNVPLSGVVLSVLDTTGATVVQVLSDENGGFEIRLPFAGRYSLDVKRIGVRRVQIAPFTVAGGETRRMDLTVDPVPAVLSSVKITGRSSCVRNPPRMRAPRRCGRMLVPH